jgi:hypothetical protein
MMSDNLQLTSLSDLWDMKYVSFDELVESDFTRTKLINHESLQHYAQAFQN